MSNEMKKKYTWLFIIILMALLYGSYSLITHFVDIPAKFQTAVRQGSILAFLLAFLGGIAVSLTPCVYPVIPITVAFIGSQNVSSRFQAFLISLSYVLGLALTYTAIGAFSAAAGKLFGTVATHPVTNILVGVIFVALGLSMLDVFLLPIPAFMRQGFANKIPSRLRGTHTGSFLIGMASGLVVGSCTLPVLAALLTYIVSKEISLLYGSMLLFTYSMGLGMIFLAAGTFSSLFTSTLKSGRWMTLLKNILALVILLMGIYFIVTAILRFF